MTQMSTLFERYDFYVTPVNAFPAPKIGELTPHDEQIRNLMRISELDKTQRDNSSMKCLSQVLRIHRSPSLQI